MEHNNIEQLLERYFEGETTLAEEKTLKSYFSSSAVPPHLEHYIPLFMHYNKVQNEQFKGTLLLINKRSNSKMWLSIAASVVVMLGVSIYTFQMYNQPVNEDLGTINDPEVAFKETQKALNMISEHINTGIHSVHYLEEYEQSKNKIFKN
jgi:hypothetical protein